MAPGNRRNAFAWYTLLMNVAPRSRPVPIEEYLVGESRSERKHEFVDGVICAMVGASNSHNLVATNVTGLLHSQLRGKNFQVFDAAAAVVYRRGEAGFAREVWTGLDQVVPLSEVGCELRLADVYANVGLRES